MTLKEESGVLYSACLRCHNTDRVGERHQVNWFGAGQEMGASDYAKFNHRAHMAMLGDAQDYLQCHQLDEQSGEAAPRPVHAGIPSARQEKVRFVSRTGPR